MTKTTGRSFGADFRQFFIRGMVILLPSVLTIWILVQAYRFVDQNIAQPLNGLTRLVVIRSIPYLIRKPDLFPDWYVITPEELNTERQRRISSSLPVIKGDVALEAAARTQALKVKWDGIIPLKFIGFAMAVILFYLAGRIFGGLIGRRLAERIEGLIARIPGFRQIYPHVKQIVDFLFGDRKLEFNRVALVEYPRPGIWTMGLVTGKPPVQWTEAAGKDLVTLFIPSSPTPFTGYTITIPRNEVTDIDVTVEEAIRFAVSGGVVIPPDRATALFTQQRASGNLPAIHNPVVDSRTHESSNDSRVPTSSNSPSGEGDTSNQEGASTNVDSPVVDSTN